jgi:hypothetical protein
VKPNLGAPSASATDAVLAATQALQAAFNSNSASEMGSLFYVGNGFQPAVVLANMGTPIVGPSAITAFYSNVRWQSGHRLLDPVAQACCTLAVGS